MRNGVDIGGTFTDAVAVGDGRILVAKVPSDSVRPARGVARALDAVGVADPQGCLHGKAPVTNLMLERKGAHRVRDYPRE